MKSELIKQGNDLAQSIYISLTSAVNQASRGEDYGNAWEFAQKLQSELLGVINKLKYQPRVKDAAKTNFGS